MRHAIKTTQWLYLSLLCGCTELCCFYTQPFSIFFTNKQKMKAVIVLLLCLISLSFGQKIWSLCGSGTLKVNDIIVSPPQPVVGQDFKVVIMGVLSQQISSGNAHV